MTDTPRASAPPALSVVETPTLAELSPRWRAAQNAHQAVVSRAWIGMLVTEFTNDELRVLIDHLTIGDVLTLRKLGVLGPDEGWDGTGPRPWEKGGRNGK